MSRLLRDINSIQWSTTPELRTHLNYVKRLALVAETLTIKLSGTNDGKLKQVYGLQKFIKLADITKKSIDSDISFCQEEKEYARICAPWLPVKCYYRIYYLESSLLYLINGDISGFKSSGAHSRTGKQINAHIKSGKLIVESSERIPGVTSVDKCLSFTIKSGENTQNSYWQNDKCIDSVMTKIAKYKLENWASTQGFNDFRTKTRREARADFLTREEISLFDYFYQMRLKANYKDVDFLSLEAADSQDVYEYVINFHKFYEAYARCLSLLIKQNINRVLS